MLLQHDRPTYNQVQAFQINYVPGQLVPIQITANYMCIVSYYCHYITDCTQQARLHKIA